jgi:sialic acid synthase SpsE
MIASTGLATLDEVAALVGCADAAGAGDLALLHCVSAYPVPPGSENLSAITTLARAFDLPIGLSDHAPTSAAVPIAVALGALLYERHFILPGDDAIDAAVSSDPADLAALVRVAASAKAALGTGHIRCAPAEAANLVPSRRALHAVRDLDAGDIVTPRDILIVRPGNGIAPGQFKRLVGTRLRRAVRAGTAFVDSDLTLMEGRHAVA